MRLAAAGLGILPLMQPVWAAQERREEIHQSVDKW
jgi:hypothetical protein